MKVREGVFDVGNNINASSVDLFSHITLEKSFDNVSKTSPSVDVNDRSSSLDVRHLQIITEIVRLISL